jgi:WD40 repeat protein
MILRMYIASNRPQSRLVLVWAFFNLNRGRCPSMASLPPPLPFAVLRGHRDGVNSVSFCVDNVGLLSGSLDGEVKLWDLQIRRPILSFVAHQTSILSVHSLSNDRFLRYVHCANCLFLVWAENQEVFYEQFRPRWRNTILGCPTTRYL